VDSAHLWSQSVARNSMMGYERTHNPSPAAAAILGKRRTKLARRKAHRIRRRAHKGNPLPAVAAILTSGLLGKLGGRFRAPSEKRAASVAPGVVAAANAGNLTAALGLLTRATLPTIGVAKERLVWQAAAAQLSPAIVEQVKRNSKSIPMADQSNPENFAASVIANAYPRAGYGGTPTAASPLGELGAYLTPGNVGTIARAVTPRRSRRARYPTYTDRYGRQRYSYKPPGSQMRLPAGASIAADTPYKFFTGALGGGGAATTAAQLGVAAAAGAAAYFGTQAILKYFGNKTVRTEEAGVQLALAAREARQQYALAHNLRGAPPTYGVPASVIRSIGAGMKAKLAELGYDEHGVRTRSGAEDFLSSYATED